MYCKNQPFDGPIERRIGYHDGYAGRVQSHKWHSEEYAVGYALGQKDRTEDDGLPRCDCGRLFEICDYPKCPQGGTKRLLDGQFDG